MPIQRRSFCRAMPARLRLGANMLIQSAGIRPRKKPAARMSTDQLPAEIVDRIQVISFCSG